MSPISSLFYFYLFFLLHIVLASNERVYHSQVGRRKTRANNSLSLFLLYHLHYPTEARRPQRAPTTPFSSSTPLIRALWLSDFGSSLLRQFWKHHFAVFVSLHNHIRDNRLDTLVVTEWTLDPLHYITLLLLDNLLVMMGLRRGSRAKLIRIHHARLRLKLVNLLLLLILLHISTGSDTWAPGSSTATTSSYLPTGYTVTCLNNRLNDLGYWLLTTFQSVVIKVIK